VRQAEAALLRDANDNAAAYAVLTQALIEHPDAPDLLYDAAMVAEKLDKIDEAEARLRRVVELKPDDAQALNALGYTLVDRTPRTWARCCGRRATPCAPMKSGSRNSRPRPPMKCCSKRCGAIRSDGFAGRRNCSRHVREGAARHHPHGAAVRGIRSLICHHRLHDGTGAAGRYRHANE
jgi:tetratricopeptide (TPR) repeat protein